MKKWLLILTGTAAAAALIFFGGKTLAQREIKEAIRDELRRSLNMEFDSLDVSVFTGSGCLYGVEMQPPVSQFLGKTAKVSAKLMRVKNVGWVNLLWFNEFDADLMEIDNPVVVLEETPATLPTPPKKEVTKGELGVIEIDRVVFRNAQFRIVKTLADTLAHTRADTLSFDLRGLRIRLNERPSLRLRHADFSLANLETAGSDSLAVPAFSAENFKVNFKNLLMSLGENLPVNVREAHFSFKKFQAKSVREASPRTWAAGVFALNLNTLRLTLKNNPILSVSSGDFALQDFLLAGDRRLGESTFSAADLRLDWKAFYAGLENLSPVSLDDASLSLKNAWVRQPGGDPFHDWHVQSLAASKSDETLKINGLEFRPKYSKTVFPQKTAFKLTRKHFEFSTIEMRGLNFDRLLKGDLVARHVAVQAPKLDAFQDQNEPPGAPVYKPTLQEALLKSSLTLHFDTVTMRDGSVRFEEIAPGKTESGVVEFSPLQVTALNVTNDLASIRRKPTMSISARAKFQKRAWVSSQFEMDLSSPSYAFTCEGSAEPMPFALFNGFLTPSANLHFEGGEIKKLSYQFRADNRSARGKMNLQYEGLDVAVQNELQEKRKLLSELAELVLLIKNNRAGDDDFRLGEISVQRDRHKGFFNFWWRAIQSGLTSTVLSNAGVKQMEKKKAKKESK